eukprot:GEMP01001848.1.p1 GENE.GEMP01001848.1~~GEMP01001848.1.p1  ORF type:complete len:1001 (-),score=212.80 GEMP01001848.1:1867-4869(-)
MKMLERLPSPEELVAEVVIIGGLMNVKLTWWYDEDVLDLVRISKLKLEFEIRQQCTGAKGRARVRSFMTAIRLEEESPQLYEVVGLSMKPYIFSVRCKSAECTSGYSVSLLVSPDGPPGVVDQRSDTSPSLLASPHWQHRPPEDSASRAALLLALRTHHQMESVGDKTPPSQNTPELTETPTESASASEFQQDAPSFRLVEPNAIIQTNAPNEFARDLYSSWRTPAGTPTPRSTPQQSDAPVHETREAHETRFPAPVASETSDCEAAYVSAVEEQTINSDTTVVLGDFPSCYERETYFPMGRNTAGDPPLKFYIGDESPPHNPSVPQSSTTNMVNEAAAQQHARMNDEKSSLYQAIGNEEVVSALERQIDKEMPAKSSCADETVLQPKISDAMAARAKHQPVKCSVDAVPNTSAGIPIVEREDRAGPTSFSSINNGREEKRVKSPNQSKREADQSLMSPWLDKILSEKTELMPRASTFDVSRLNFGAPSMDSFNRASPRRTPPTSQSFTVNAPKSSAPSSRSFTTAKGEMDPRNRGQWQLDSRLQAMNMAAQHMKKAIRPSIEPVSEEELSSRIPNCETHSEALHNHYPPAERPPVHTTWQVQQNNPVLGSSPALGMEDPRQMRREVEGREVMDDLQKDSAEKTVNAHGVKTAQNNTTQHVTRAPQTCVTPNPRRHSLQASLRQMCIQQQHEFIAGGVGGGAPPRQLNTTISLPRGALQPHRPAHSALTPKSAYTHVTSPTGNNLNHTRGVRGLIQRPPPSAVSRNASTPNPSFDLRSFGGNIAARPPHNPHLLANPFSSMPSSMFATPVAAPPPQGPPTPSLYPLASSGALQFGNQLTSMQDRQFAPATQGPAPPSGDSFPFYCVPPQSVPQYPSMATESYSAASIPQLAPSRSYVPRRDSGGQFKQMPAPTKRTAPAFEREPEKTDRYQISIQVSDSQWETLQWSLPLEAGKTLSQVCLSFLKERGLKDAFHSGLVYKMNQLPSSGQVSAMVDIVDLI